MLRGIRLSVNETIWDDCNNSVNDNDDGRLSHMKMSDPKKFINWKSSSGSCASTWRRNSPHRIWSKDFVLPSLGIFPRIQAKLSVLRSSVLGEGNCSCAIQSFAMHFSRFNFFAFPTCIYIYKLFCHDSNVDSTKFCNDIGRDNLIYLPFWHKNALNYFSKFTKRWRVQENNWHIWPRSANDGCVFFLSYFLFLYCVLEDIGKKTFLFDCFQVYSWVVFITWSRKWCNKHKQHLCIMTMIPSQVRKVPGQISTVKEQNGLTAGFGWPLVPKFSRCSISPTYWPVVRGLVLPSVTQIPQKKSSLLTQSNKQKGNNFWTQTAVNLICWKANKQRHQLKSEKAIKFLSEW